jgi:hypothetical protein
LIAAAPLSFSWSPAKTLSLSVDKAEARIGRPLTPGSVAGVNRRVHRRAYYGASGSSQPERTTMVPGEPAATILIHPATELWVHARARSARSRLPRPVHDDHTRAALTAAVRVQPFAANCQRA